MAVENISWLAWWSEADWIVRLVFLLLLALSLASWTVIVFKVWQFASIHRHERRLGVGIIGGAPPANLAAALPEHVPSVHLLRAADGCGAAVFNAGDRSRTEAVFSHILKERRMEMENFLTLLATTGNAAPFIGLFGTVWGIMHALQGLGGDAALSMDMIAGPVAEALTATAAGLFVAIPAVVGYNLLLRRLRRIMGIIEGNAMRILDAFFPPAERKS